MSKRIMNFLKNMRKSFTENPRGGLAYSNSSGRSLNRYNNAHKTRKECVLAPACLAKSHKDAILTSREGLPELLHIFSKYGIIRETGLYKICIMR